MKKWLVVLLALALIFTFAACGQKEAPAQEGATETPEQAAEETPTELITVKVGSPSPLEVLGYAQWLCAEYMGYFEEEGIDLVMVPQAGTDVCKMLESGEVDFSLPAPALLFTAGATGIDMRAVYQHDCNNIFGFAVLEDGDIKDWSDLEGASIVTDAAWYFLSDPVLAAAGVDVDSITVVSAADERSVMLATGSVDAAFTWQKEWQLWEAEGVNIRYLDGEEVLPNTANAVVCLTSYYEDPANKAIIEGLGRALAKGTYFCERNPEAAAAITVNRWPSLGLSPEEAVGSIKALVACSTPDSHQYGESELDRWQLTLDWLVEYEIVDPATVDLASLLVSDKFLAAYNDWDYADVEADAANFDISSVEHWTDSSSK